MAALDWIVIITTLVFIVGYGVWKNHKSQGIADYLKGNNQSNWWTIGLSVMATQASAITFLSTPGQAFHDGMGFVQFYFGLPIAMVVICLVFVPLYHRLKVYTAYEFLESRFDLKTRSLTAGLFLVQRSLAAGITIYAPAIILSAVMGWSLAGLNIGIGVLVILYTVSGGTKAVNTTQKQQMAVIFGGMIIAFFVILNALPPSVGFADALEVAAAGNKLDILDFSFDFDVNNRYTIWSGLIGGTFLALSYFGTDQSQVQRYLSGRSVRESQLGLIFNGLLKVPMQFFILLVGVMVFVFYQYNSAPLHFKPDNTQAVLASDMAEEYCALEALQQENFVAKQALLAQLPKAQPTEREALKTQLSEHDTRDRTLRNRAKTLIEQANPDAETNDKDYVFIHFILRHLPRGLVGLLLAVILSAAMSSTASELNALAATTTIDIYKRNVKQAASEKHYLTASKGFTLLWGLIAIGVASVANLFENLIELVNIIGSIFYGNVLGIFLLAFFVKFVRGNAVFVAALITQTVVVVGYFQDWMAYLWLNVFGCALVMLLAILIQAAGVKKRN